MEVKEILKSIRKKRGLSAQQVAEGSGISHGVYKKYESGEIGLGLPPLIKLADFYNVTTDYLLDREQPDNPPDPITQFIREMGISGYEEILIRVFFALPSKQRAEFTKNFCIGIDEELERKSKKEIPQEVIDETAAADETPLIPIPFAISKVSAGVGCMLSDDYPEKLEIDIDTYPKANLAIQISGDSMEPKYNDGDIVLVHEQPALDNGDIGIFIKDDEGFIKKYHIDNGKAVLRSLNVKYKDIEIGENDDCRIVGKVMYRFEGN